MAEENEKPRKNEMELVKLMFSQLILFSKDLLHQYFFITTVLLQVEIHLLFSKVLVIKITLLQKKRKSR